MRRLSRWIAAIAFILVVAVSVLAVVDNRRLVALHFLELGDAGNQHLLVVGRRIRARRHGRLDQRGRTHPSGAVR